MPGMSGLELQAQLKRRTLQDPIIFITDGTKECGCRRWSRPQWSSWQNRSMTEPCSRVFVRFESEPSSEAVYRGAQGGLVAVSQDSGPLTKT